MRALWYLKGNPRMIMKFNAQEDEDELEMYVDSDHAGRRRTRRSTSGGVAMLGQHILMEYSITQPVVAFSSGESEFYTIVKGITTGLYIKSLLKFFDIEIKVKVLSDSSAGRGMISRLGVGKRVKHIDTQFMFAQGVIRDGIAKIGPAPGEWNVSDIRTKYVTRPTLDRLLKVMNMVFLTLASLVPGAEADEKYAKNIEKKLNITDTDLAKLAFMTCCISMLTWTLSLAALCYWWTRQGEKVNKEIIISKMPVVDEHIDQIFYKTEHGAKLHLYTTFKSPKDAPEHRKFPLAARKYCMVTRGIKQMQKRFKEWRMFSVGTELYTIVARRPRTVDSSPR